jgi:ribosomal silencing factor RsfS
MLGTGEERTANFGFVGKGEDKYMATLKQIDANRRNALKSTGPRTPEGKAVVSMNALKHGLRARTVVLPSENAEEFHQLCDDLEAEWQPQSRTEQFYVEQMAVSQWKLNRMEVGEVNVFTNETRAQTQLPMLDRLWQAQCRLERSYARAQHDLERLQKSRRPSDHPRRLAAQPGEAPSVSAGALAPEATIHPCDDPHAPEDPAPPIATESSPEEIQHPAFTLPLAYNASKGESIYGKGHGSQERDEEAEKEEAIS